MSDLAPFGLLAILILLQGAVSGCRSRLLAGGPAALSRGGSASPANPGAVLSLLELLGLAVQFALAVLLTSLVVEAAPRPVRAGTILAGALAALGAAHVAGRAAGARWAAPLVAAAQRIVAALPVLVSPGGSRPCPKRPRRRAPAISDEEADQLIRKASLHGALLHGESEVLLNLIAFGREPLRSFMTPRTDIHALDAGWPPPAILEAIRTHRHRRFPVVRGGLEEVLGCVVAKEYCLEPDRGLTAHLRPLPFVPESKVAGDLFQEMRAAGYHMALVVNEYGDISGMVTLGGLVSRLMGDIPDEFRGEPTRLLRLGGGRYVADGALPVEKLNAETGLDLPVRPNKTVGGLVLSLAGHLPAPGETFEAPGARFEVLSVWKRRIRTLRVDVR